MGLMKKLTSAVVASSLVLGLVGTSFAAEATADDVQAAFARLNHYGVAEGILREDGTKDPALDENLTRAQIVAMIVKAFGQKENAEMLAGAETFADVPTGHWASGYIAIAKNIAARHGNTIGYPDGTFGPENEVTAIEALGFVLKFLGVQVSGGDDWVANMIAAAKDAGVITDADEEKYLANPNEPATRGLAFALADSIFYNYNGLDGKSVYTKYLDTEAPAVELDAAPATTEKANIEITGKVSGDYREVYVGSDAITVAEDGTFSAQVALEVGTNVIEVSAKDWAGNVGTDSVTVERVPGDAAKVQIVAPEGPVVAGSTIDLPVLVVDAEGADTGLTDVTVDAGEAGTWAEGKLTAATKAGKYTITASYEGLEPATLDIEIVAGPLAGVQAETKSVAPGTAVKLIAVDQYGNPVGEATFAKAEDYANVFVEGDQFIATKPGTYKVVATKGEGEEAETAEGEISVFGEHASFDIVIEDELVANGATEYEVKVVAVDKDGNAVTDFAGTVTLETNFVEAQSKDAEDGVAVFKVKVDEGMAGLEAEFTARYQPEDDDAEAIEATESFEVKAQVGTSLKLEGHEFLAINDPAFSGTVTILDQVGEELVFGEDHEITLTITGPAYFAENDEKELTIELSGGSASFELKPVDRYTDGLVTITATSEGLTSGTLEVKAVYALDPKDIEIEPVSKDAVKAAQTEKPFEFKIILTDKNGVPVTADDDYPMTIEFDSDSADKQLTVNAVDSDNGSVLQDAKPSDGKVTLTFPKDKAHVLVKVTAEKLTGDVKFTVTENHNSLDLGKASGTVSFKAGDPVQLAFEKDELNVLSNTENTLTISLQDNAGNKVAKSGVEVTIEAADEATYAKPGYVKLGDKKPGEGLKVKTDDEGKVTVPITLLPYVNNNETAKIVAKADGYASDEAFVTVRASVSKTISVTTYVYTDKWERASSFNAGDVVFVRAVVTDNNGITVTDPDFAGRLSLSGVKLTEVGDGEARSGETLADFQWGGNLSSFDVEDLDGTTKTVDIAPVDEFVTAFVARKAGSFSIKVADDTAATKVERSRGISVKAGAPVGLAYVGDKVTFKENEPVKVVLNVVDVAGNKVSTSAVKDTTGVEIEGVKFEVELKDGKGMLRESATGLDNAKLQITIEKSVASYTIYVVAGDEDVTTEDLVITKVN